MNAMKGQASYMHLVHSIIRFGCIIKFLLLTLGYGYYNLPSVTEYRLNKYELPSYYQFNIDIRYKFEGYFEGLEMQCLIVRKESTAHQEGEKYIFNKNNLTNYNFVINYHFGK
ncbi:hypothetical protein V9L05_21110 [Bernardetia sp. Wsw4-3y2]|uniref:hypothetical protein n=1 Tax=Bernardetia sp. Wsw4-3y2 TaxID=3127471 RepID=UPI0030D37D86